MNALIDCHTHIHQHNENEHKEIIQRALSANVKIIVSAGTNINDSKKALLISERNENVFAGIGIHPTELKRFETELINETSYFRDYTIETGKQVNEILDNFKSFCFIFFLTPPPQIKTATGSVAGYFHVFFWFKSYRKMKLILMGKH